MKEIRNNETIKRSKDSESRIIEGYCVVFNSRSQDLGGFFETINPNAISQETINNSDIYFLLNHNVDRGILARSNKGTGSLNLELDSHGLKFSFEAPKTELGNEVLEGIKRNDVSKCSFAFTVADDVYSKESDGTILRTINRIERLYDCSIVYNPAYSETTVDLRGLKAFLSDSNEENNADNTNVQMSEEKRLEEELRATNEEEKETDKEETNQEEEKSEAQEKTDEDKKEDSEEINSDETDDDKEEKDCKDPDKDKRNIKVNPNSNNIIMKRNFSLLQTINNIANNKPIDAVAETVIAEGRSAANKAGLTSNGQIQIALEPEKRFEDAPNGILASQNVEAVTYGGEAVPTDTFDILGALRDRLIVSELGARMLNLSGNVDIPVYDGANCTWESEIGEAQEGNGKFKTVKLSPKRLTAYLPISKQFLIQTSESAETLLRNDLIDCIAEKLQQTMFGDGAGSDVEPQGLFNGVVAEGSAFKFEDAVAMEELLELNNVYGEKKYVVSPATKAILRTTPIDKGSGRFVMENNEVLGVETFSTSSVTGKGIILGDWSNLYIANFGALDLTIDTVTRARNAQVVLVVNMWVDYAVVRPEAFVKKILA